MFSVSVIEPSDLVLPMDWCRPLSLVSMSGGMSDSYSFESMYTGGPENNVKWVRIKDVFGECWFGKPLSDLNTHISYEVVRGSMPESHRLKHKDLYEII